MCFLSVYVLFLGCYVSLVHTQWAWNPAGMCLIWKFYPLGLVNSNRRLRTALQCRQECGHGESSVQRSREPRCPCWKVPQPSLKLLCSLLCSVRAGGEGWASFALLYTLSVHSCSLPTSLPSLPPRSAAAAGPRQDLGRDCCCPLMLGKMAPWPAQASTLYFVGR